ncbi:hypothetical protein ACR77J_16645 [Tissierella praeacuta]|uniref:hypothetical protein n=1 Tax=Tissierella praeacuta TaxID=43131 RepID=UPI003DA58482
MSKFVTTQYGASKEILKFNNFTSVSVTVDGVDIPADGNGKKIVKAGTIVAGKTKPVLQNSNEPVAKKNGAEAEGVLLTDVDVTYGQAPGSMVIFGFIDVNKLPEAPTTEALEALNMIKFLK